MAAFLKSPERRHHTYPACDMRGHARHAGYVRCRRPSNMCCYGVFGTTGQVVPTSGQVVETTCECSVVSTTDFYQLSGSVQLQI